MIEILKKYYLLIVVFIPIIGGNYNANASHIAGADIEYTCLGGDTFRIVVNVYRDCSGIGEPQNMNATITSPCGAVTPVWTLIPPITSPPQSNNGTEISALCPPLLQTSTCWGGTLPGMTRISFETVVVLPPCNFWTVQYTAPCCRNTSGTLVGQPAGPSITATINNVDGPCNNSPQFTSDPLPYFCLNQNVNYNFGAVDADGDSIVYSFVTAQSAPGVPNNYQAPYTFTVPVASSSGVNLNPLTGQITFTPTQLGNWVFAVQVSEYRNGVLISTQVRDILFVVITCTNNVPPPSPGITNFSGSATLIDPYNVQGCVGQNFTFDLEFSDPDVTDSLHFSSNIALVLPGAQTTVIYPNAPLYNTMIVRISWIVLNLPGRFHTFFITATDQACPIPGNSTTPITIELIRSTYAGLDQIICLGDTATLSGFTDSTYLWSVISPPPLPWVNYFSCDTCAETTVTPTQSTIYELFNPAVSTNSCKVRDTVRVQVAQDYELNTRADTIICYNDADVEIFVNPTINAQFSYQWDNGNKLSNDTIRNPIATPIISTVFNVTATSDSGCIRTATTQVRVTPPFPNYITIGANDTVSCAGSPIELEILLGREITSCGTTTESCEGLLTEYTLGTGFNLNETSGANAYPTPYGNSQRSSRQQYLIRASELNALGVYAGTIYSLAFDVFSNNGLSQYTNFEIKMKCTSDSILNNWQSGMQTVYFPKTTNAIVAGWNNHSFDLGFDYDGSSNIVVEVCFFRQFFPSENARVRHSNTTYSSSLYNFSFSSNFCGNNTINGTANMRPNMRFNFCDGPNPAGFVYQWEPTTYLSDSTTKIVFANISDSISYKAYVQDTSGSCFDTAGIRLLLSTMDITNDTTVCPGADVQLFADGKSTCVDPQRTYQWSPSWAVNNDTIPNPIANVDSTTTLYVSFTDPCGCTLEDSITIFMKTIAPPNLIKTPPSCGFDNGAIQLDQVDGTAPFLFSIDSGISVRSNNIFDSLNNGYLNIWVQDAEGCEVRLRDTFTNTAPIIDSLTFISLSCYEENKGNINVYSSGGLGTIVYSIDSGKTWQASNTFFNLPSGQYYAMAMSEDSCITKPSPILLTQPDRLVADFQIDSITCFGFCDAQISTQGLGGTAPYFYTWPQIGSDSTVSNLCENIYQLILSDSNDCIFDTSFVIGDPAELVIDNIAISPITCNGFNNGQINISAMGGTNALAYSINNGNSYFTFSRFDSITPGTYNIVVRDGNLCTASQSITVVEPDRMVLTTNFDSTMICVSTCADIFALTSGGNGTEYQYFWSPSHADTNYLEVCPTRKFTNISLYAVDSAGCVSNTKLLTIGLYDSLSVEVDTAITICSVFDTELNAEPSGGDGNGYNYLWTPYPGLDNPLRKRPKASPDSTTTYTVKVTDNCGSPAVFADVLVTVNPMPVLDVEIDAVSGCAPFEITFTNNGTQNENCFWYVNNSDNAFRSCNILTYTYRNAGAYDVKFYIETSKGCIDSVIMFDALEIFSSPSADFEMEPENPSAFNPLVEFTDNSVGDIVSWHWQIGSLIQSLSQDTSFEFPVQDTATYPVKLTVTNRSGCTDEIIKKIFLDTEYYLFVPNAFTPNQDGLNDIFLPVSNGVTPDKYQLKIFDRWGQVVFETSNAEEGWNGRLMNTGDPVSAGVYVWKINASSFATSADGEERSGNVTLIR